MKNILKIIFGLIIIAFIFWNRVVRFIDDTDANGNPEKQYFVLVNKPKEITEEAKRAFGNQIKPDPKTLSYVKQHEDKYN
jgi:hypothetical protein